VPPLKAVVAGMGREKVGRPAGCPPYFTVIEALAVFVRDAQKEAA